MTRSSLAITVYRICKSVVVLSGGFIVFASTGAAQNPTIDYLLENTKLDCLVENVEKYRDYIREFGAPKAPVRIDECDTIPKNPYAGLGANLGPLIPDGPSGSKKGVTPDRLLRINETDLDCLVSLKPTEGKYQAISLTPCQLIEVYD